MGKSELVAAITEKTGMKKKDVTAAVEAFTAVVSEELATGGKVQLVGFGTFYVADRAAREGRNPATGEPLHIPASKSAKFKAGKALKTVVNQ